MKKNRLFEEDWKQCNDEAKMAKIQLKSIQSNVEELLAKIESCGEIDAWVQSYLTKADDYLDSVKKYVVFGEEDAEIIQPIPVEEPEGDESVPMTGTPEPEPIMPPIDDYDPDAEPEPMDLTPGVPGEDELPEPEEDELPEPEEVEDELPEPEEDELPEPEEGEEWDDIEMPSLDNFQIQGGEARFGEEPMPRREEEDELSFDDLDFFNSEEFAEPEEEVDLEDDFDEVNESLVNDKGITQIFFEGYPWYIKKIDSTRFYMANNEEAFESGAAWPYHIGEHRGRPYYEDIRQWLHGGPDPEGKKY